MTIRIALDAMGGDFLATPNLQGCYRAVRKDKDLKVFLCGQKDVLQRSLEETCGNPEVPLALRINRRKFDNFMSEGRIEFIDCSQIVEMHESPSSALRSKKKSSMAKCYELVKEGLADAVVSAGNSGAMMAYGMKIFGRIPSVKRPAILVHFPTKDGVSGLTDAGANVDCTAQQLEQFAIMGRCYMKNVFEVENVRVALLNIGEEESKGNELVKETAALLKARMPESYIGFIEGRDLFEGRAEVIVCDGFVGNVALKVTEGAARTLSRVLKEELARTPLRSIGAWIAKGGLSAMKSKLDYKEYGAAPLVGLNGLTLVAHGSSDGKAIASALGIAERYVGKNLMEKLNECFVGYEEDEA